MPRPSCKIFTVTKVPVNCLCLRSYVAGAGIKEVECLNSSAAGVIVLQASVRRPKNVPIMIRAFPN